MIHNTYSKLAAIGSMTAQQLARMPHSEKPYVWSLVWTWGLFVWSLHILCLHTPVSSDILTTCTKCCLQTKALISILLNIYGHSWNMAHLHPFCQEEWAKNTAHYYEKICGGKSKMFEVIQFKGNGTKY